MKTIATRKAEVTVKRPDGTVETITHPKVDYITLSGAEEVAAVVEMEESDYQGTCERCGTAIDTRKVYHQQERMSFGGSTVKVAAYYCNHCRQLLTEIGKGEYTPMQERATERPDNTPNYKED